MVVEEQSVVYDWNVFTEKYCFSAVIGVFTVFPRLLDILALCGEQVRIFLLVKVSQEEMYAVIILTIVTASVLR